MLIEFIYQLELQPISQGVKNPVAQRIKLIHEILQTSTAVHESNRSVFLLDNLDEKNANSRDKRDDVEFLLFNSNVYENCSTFSCPYVELWMNTIWSYIHFILLSKFLQMNSIIWICDKFNSVLIFRSLPFMRVLIHILHHFSIDGNSCIPTAKVRWPPMRCQPVPGTEAEIVSHP